LEGQIDVSHCGANAARRTGGPGALLRNARD
jgi:hypothetical protein